MRTVYAVQLGIDSRDGTSPDQVYSQLRDRCSGWIVQKYKRTWGKDIALPADDAVHAPVEGHTLRVNERSHESSQLFTLEWGHPHDQDPSSTWITGITIARHGDDVELGLVLRVATTQMVIRPVGVNLGRPRFLSDILDEYSVRRGPVPLRDRAQRLTTRDIEPFVEDTLLSSTRVEPVIMISPNAWSERPLIDPDIVFARTREFAHVAVMDSKWAAFKLTDALDRDLACFDGAVRIYWPGFALDSSPYDHRLYLRGSFRPGSERSEIFARNLFRLFASISAFRFVEGAATKAARRVFAERDRADIQRLREAAKSGTADKAELEEELLEALVKIDDLTVERDQLREDLDAQKAAWAEVQSFTAGATQAEAADENAEQTSSGYATVAKALAAAKKNFTGPLLFLDSAERSASESPYKNPDRVYEVFEALHLVATEWRAKKGNLGQTWKEAMQALGFEFKDQISSTSKGKWRSEYEFPYNGQLRLFEKHVTIGAKQADKCLSVHLYRDDDDLVLVVGHCGRHLTNTKS